MNEITPPTAKSGNALMGTSNIPYMAGDMALATTTQSINKGGMRGLGLIAMAIAEFTLKKKALDLASDYYDTNKTDYNFNANTHQGPMQQSVQEAFGPANPDYVADAYTSVPGGIAKSAVIDRQWYEARRRIPKYNVGQQRRLDYDMAVARAHAVMAGWNIGIRYELNWADDHNQRAFNRRIAVTNIGIGVGNIVREGLAASVQQLSSAYDNVGDMVASFGNGYAQKSGYTDARGATKQRF